MSQSNVKLFEKEEFGKVRVVMQGEDPWFVASDVCDILEMGNPRSSLALLDEDEKGVHSMDTPGGKQEMTIISEPGLYSLILRPDKIFGGITFPSGLMGNGLSTGPGGKGLQDDPHKSCGS